MKAPPSRLIVLGLVAGLFLGCGLLKRAAITEEVEVLRPAQTNWVEQIAYSTNVVSDVITNAAGEQLVLSHTNIVTTTNLQPIILPAVLFTNKVMSATADKGLRATGRVASNLGVPFADAIAGGLAGIAGLVFGWMNRRKKREALEALDGERADKDGIARSRGMAEDAVAVLTQNIDTIREAAMSVPGYEKHDEKVMRAIKAAQKLVNVHGKIDEVRKSTRVLNDKT